MLKQIPKILLYLFSILSLLISVLAILIFINADYGQFLRHANEFTYEPTGEGFGVIYEVITLGALFTITNILFICLLFLRKKFALILICTNLVMYVVLISLNIIWGNIADNNLRQLSEDIQKNITIESIKVDSDDMIDDMIDDKFGPMVAVIMIVNNNSNTQDLKYHVESKIYDEKNRVNEYCWGPENPEFSHQPLQKGRNIIKLRCRYKSTDKNIGIFIIKGNQYFDLNHRFGPNSIRYNMLNL